MLLTLLKNVGSTSSWFCRNPGLALPLIALQYHEVKVVLTFGASAYRSVAGTFQLLSGLTTSILDTDERRRFAQVSHEYLIEQVQFVDSSTAATSHDLNLNHPVKELSGLVVSLCWWFSSWSINSCALTLVTTNLFSTVMIDLPKEISDTSLELKSFNITLDVVVLL